MHSVSYIRPEDVVYSNLINHSCIKKESHEIESIMILVFRLAEMLLLIVQRYSATQLLTERVQHRGQ